MIICTSLSEQIAILINKLIIPFIKYISIRDVFLYKIRETRFSHNIYIGRETYHHEDELSADVIRTPINNGNSTIF